MELPPDVLVQRLTYAGFVLVAYELVKIDDRWPYQDVLRGYNVWNRHAIHDVR